MNKAKFVMFIYALLAILSMMGIGLSISFVGMVGTKYDMPGLLGMIACIIAMGAIFMMGFKTKRKFRDQGLL